MSQSSKENCVSCRLPKGQYHCGVCEAPVCKGCAIFLAEGTFAFLAELPEELKHSFYCAPCHDAQVEPELAIYRETMEKAREVYFFFNTQKKAVPGLLKRGRERVKVDDCADRDETILRLGFLAAAQGYNAIIEADVRSEQVRNHGWQKSRWIGEGWPAQVDGMKIE